MSTKAERRAKKRASREERNVRRVCFRLIQRRGWDRRELRKRVERSFDGVKKYDPARNEWVPYRPAFRWEQSLGLLIYGIR